MTRIDEIMKRHTEAEQQGTDSKAWEQLEIEAWRDIKYLLSKLEIAEKALTSALEGDGVERQYEEVIEDYTQLYNAVDQTLKQLRE